MMRLTVFLLCWLNGLANVYSFNPDWTAGSYSFPQNAPGYVYTCNPSQPYPRNGNNPFLDGGREKYGFIPNSNSISRPQYSSGYYPANIWRPLPRPSLNDPSMPDEATTMAAAAYIKRTTTTPLPFDKDKPLRWVPASKGAFPPYVITGGYEYERTGSIYTLFICQAEHLGQLMIGKLQPDKGHCFIPSDGREYAYDDYEVLTNPSELIIVWRNGSNGSVPPEAFRAAKTKDGEYLYIGRTRTGPAGDGIDAMVPGKVQPSLKSLFITYQGSEKRFHDYSVLCWSPPRPRRKPKASTTKGPQNA